MYILVAQEIEKSAIKAKVEERKLKAKKVRDRKGDLTEKNSKRYDFGLHPCPRPCWLTRPNHGTERNMSDL